MFHRWRSNEQGWYFCLFLLWFGCVILLCLMDSSNLRIQLNYRRNPHLFQFFCVLTGLTGGALVCIAQYAAFSTRPWWYRWPLALLTVLPLWWMYRYFENLELQKQLPLANHRLDPSDLVHTLQLCFGISFVIAQPFRWAAGNIQNIRFRTEQERMQYAAAYPISLRTLITLVVVGLGLYLYAGNPRFLNRLLPSTDEVPLLLMMGNAAAASLFLSLFSLIPTRTRYSWLAWLFFLCGLLAWYATVSGLQFWLANASIAQSWNLPDEQSLAFLLYLFPVVPAIYFTILWLSGTLPFAYTGPMARAAKSQNLSTETNVGPSLTRKVLSVGLPMIALLSAYLSGWFLPGFIQSHFNVLTFAASDKNGAWSDAILVSDLLKFIDPLEAEGERDYWLRRHPIRLGEDSLEQVAIDVKQVSSPTWKDLFRRINQVNGSVSISILGAATDTDVLLPGQNLYHLDGRFLSLADLPPGTPTHLKLDYFQLGPEVFTQLPASCDSIHLQNSKFHMGEHPPWPRVQNSNIFWTFQDCQFDEMGLKVALLSRSEFMVSQLPEHPWQTPEFLAMAWSGHLTLANNPANQSWLERERATIEHYFQSGPDWLRLIFNQHPLDGDLPAMETPRQNIDTKGSMKGIWLANNAQKDSEPKNYPQLTQLAIRDSTSAMIDSLPRMFTDPDTPKRIQQLVISGQAEIEEVVEIFLNVEDLSLFLYDRAQTNRFGMPTQALAESTSIRRLALMANPLNASQIPSLPPNLEHLFVFYSEPIPLSARPLLDRDRWPPGNYQLHRIPIAQRFDPANLMWFWLLDQLQAAEVDLPPEDQPEVAVSPGDSSE